MKIFEKIQDKLTTLSEFRPTVRGGLEIAAFLGATLVGMAVEDHLRTDPSEKLDTTVTTTTTSVTDGSYPPITLED